jgi:hypothetical protein
MEGLETTHLSSAKAPTAVAPLEGLEVTSAPQLPRPPPAAPMEGLESFARSGQEVRSERMLDLDLGRTVDPSPNRTPAPMGRMPCLYCGNVQTTGLVCDKCGMRRHVVRPKDLAKAAEEDRQPCRICGNPVAAGARCGECGSTAEGLD